MRLIDADTLMGELHNTYLYDDSARKVIYRKIEERPTVEPQRIKGRWERKESDLSWWYECSECGESPLFDPYEQEVRTPFCPWCGAEMRQQEEQGNVTLN